MQKVLILSKKMGGTGEYMTIHPHTHTYTHTHTRNTPKGNKKYSKKTNRQQNYSPPLCFLI